MADTSERRADTISNDHDTNVATVAEASNVDQAAAAFGPPARPSAVDGVGKVEQIAPERSEQSLRLPNAQDDRPERRAKRERRVAMLQNPMAAETTALPDASQHDSGAHERKSRSGWLAAALVLALVGWMASGMLGADEPAVATAPARATEPEPVAVEVATSRAQPIERALTIEGEVEPGLSTPVRAEAGGIIEAVEARKGTLVEAGDVIARIRPDERDAALAQARDAVEAAQAEFDRVDSLVARGFATRSRLEEARTGLSAAQSQLANAQAGFNDLTITAPASGALNALEIDPGEVVQPGAEVATIVDTSRLLIEIRVPQRAIADVEVGQRAEVAFVTGQRAEGRVTFVAANAESATRTFPIEIEVANPDRAIPSGISAEVRLPIEEIEAHFVSPAILSLGENGALGVKVVETDETVGFYPAELVRAETGGIWVSGLPDEATIITVGQGFVATGERVRAVAEGETPELPASDGTPEPVTADASSETEVTETSVAEAGAATSTDAMVGDGVETVRVETVAPTAAAPEAADSNVPDGIVVTTIPLAPTENDGNDSTAASRLDDGSGADAADDVAVRVETEIVPVETEIVPVETEPTTPDVETETLALRAEPTTEPSAEPTTGVAPVPPAPLNAPAPLDPEQVIVLAQERLAELGYDVGPATGEENPRTRVAVGRFQADENLPLSGDLTDATLARLGVRETGAVPRTDPVIDGVVLDPPLGTASVQTALDALGYDPGAADGLLGPNTRAAIREFQEAEGLEPTGRPGPELTRALRAAAREQN